MSVRLICLCIAAALLLSVIVLRIVRSRRRKQEQETAVEEEMQQRLRAIDEYVAEEYYPMVKTIKIFGMADLRKMFLVKNALSLVCRGTQVGISLEQAQAIVYLKEAVSDDVLREAVERQGCEVIWIASSNQEIRKEPRNGKLLPVSDPHRAVMDYGN